MCYEYLGWMIASGATGAEAQAHLEELARGVHFTDRPILKSEG